MTPHPEAPTRRLWISVLLAGLLSACATAPPATPEERVRQRANERWQLYVAGKHQQAYAYFSPASRALTSYERWRGGIGNATVLKGAEVVMVTCETSEKCIARIKLQHEPLMWRSKLGTIESAVDETWLTDGSEWWLFHTP